jgi:hypothetical protein
MSKSQFCLRLFAFFFGWMSFLLALCFMLPEITSTPLRAILLILLAALALVVYALDPSIVLRYRTSRLLVLYLQILCVIVHCAVAIYCMRNVGSGQILLGGVTPIGSSRIWCGGFFFLMALGSISGPLLIFMNRTSATPR